MIIFQKPTFREARLVNKTNYFKLFSPNPRTRAEEVLNNIPLATAHSKKFNEGTSAMMQAPVKDSILGFRDQIKSVLSLPLDIAKETAEFAINTISKPVSIIGNAAINLITAPVKMGIYAATSTVGAIGNVLRIGADAIRFPWRLLTIGTDYIADKIGLISTIARSTREKALSAVDDASKNIFSIGTNTRNRALSVVGATA